MVRSRFLIPLFFLCQYPFYATAQEVSAPFVKVSGEVTKPITLNRNDLATMKRTMVRRKDRSGNTNTYSGVALQEILEMAGATMGKQLHGENLTKYLLVKCADGYEVLFSLAELDSSFTDRMVILADKIDGNLLPVDKGPFQLIVGNEKKPARSSFQVTELVVRFAKE